MYEIDQYTVIVYNTTDLQEAVSSAHDYNTVFLGANIEIPLGGVVIDPNKDSLVIDGENEGERHSLTDYNSVLPTATLSIQGASDMTLTLQNMDLVGRNYYGMPCVFESVDTDNVTVIYNNISYTGPQVTFNPRGLTRYIDCDIRISYPLGTGRQDEAGEVNRIEFDGVNTILHYSDNDPTAAVFWFRGTAGTASCTILPGGSVYIETVNYVMYNSVGLTPTYPSPVAWEIGEGGKLSVLSAKGFSYNDDHEAVSFMVGERAEFRYVQMAANDTDASLYIQENLVVDEGASFYMEALYADASPLIQFSGAGDMVVINPKSFVLYLNDGYALGFGEERGFTFTGAQVNFWNVPPLAAGPGGMDDIPVRGWMTPDMKWRLFTLGGHVYTDPAVSTAVEFTSLLPEEIDLLPPLSDLQLQQAYVLSLGNLPILQNPIADDHRPISGWTEPNANMRIQYDTNVVEDRAQVNGRYEIGTDAPLPIGTQVTILANTPFLITQVTHNTIQAGDLEIIAAPRQVYFKSSPELVEDVAVLKRRPPEEPVIVKDIRLDSTPWGLLLALSQPLTTQQGDVWADGVVFAAEGIADRVVLSDRPITVFTGGPHEETTSVEWPETQGVLVEMKTGIRIGRQYIALADWSLIVQ